VRPASSVRTSGQILSITVWNSKPVLQQASAGDSFLVRFFVQERETVVIVLSFDLRSEFDNVEVLPLPSNAVLAYEESELGHEC
jgi:hypothetical protein